MRRARITLRQAVGLAESWRLHAVKLVSFLFLLCRFSGGEHDCAYLIAGQRLQEIEVVLYRGAGSARVSKQYGTRPRCRIQRRKNTDFWISKEATVVPAHVAFEVSSSKQVEAFHKAAIAAGGKDNGSPGYREYSPGYYAAFVFDPDGNNIEAVWYDKSKAK